MNANDTTPAIEVRGVRKRFGATLALDGVTLSVGRGRILGLIGLNGAGKSTLIRAVMGLLPPDEGTVRLEGVDVFASRAGAVAKVGYVPDRPNVYPWMRVAGVMEFAAACWPSWNRVLAADLLKRYDLNPRAKCGKLSKGQGAKLSLLLALAHEPTVLVLDEPTDGLDPVARDEFLEQVLAGAMDSPEERTVLISSHALGELQRLTDDVAILHRGRVLASGATADLLARTKRVRCVAEGDSTPMVSGARCVRRAGREWTFTLDGDHEPAAAALRSSPGVASVLVEDVTLDDLFRDYVLGAGKEGAA